MKTDHQTPVWQRANRENPCPICGKYDYCGISSEGTAAICMRISAGSLKATKNGGFLHRINGEPRKIARIAPKKRSGSELTAVIRNYQDAINPVHLEKLGANLGVSVENLTRLGIGWAINYRAWAFPMVDSTGNARGIRLRRDNGRKFAVRGGHEGLFVPRELAIPSGSTAKHLRQLLITEGPTDCAALLDLGFDAIGRPSCTGGTKIAIDFIRRYRSAEVVIVADADTPGQRGAESLACAAMPYAASLRVIRPPDGVKDVREWKRRGALRLDVLAAIEAAAVRRLSVSGRFVGSKGVVYGE